MNRTSKTVYSDDDGRELISISNGKAKVERAYLDHGADQLDELALACRAAAEELRSMQPQMDTADA